MLLGTRYSFAFFSRNDNDDTTTPPLPPVKTHSKDSLNSTVDSPTNNNINMAEKTENAPLISSSQAQVAAAAGAGAINAASSKIKKATQDGPLTFRIMGFIGGLAMIVSNGLGIVDRFMSFNFTGSLIAIYGCLFGIMSKEHTNFGWVFLVSRVHRILTLLFPSHSSQSPCWKWRVSIAAKGAM